MVRTGSDADGARSLRPLGTRASHQGGREGGWVGVCVCVGGRGIKTTEILYLSTLSLQKFNLYYTKSSMDKIC